jgi:hypothetical protein
MSRRTFKCNNIQQNVMSKTPNLKNPNKTQKKTNKTPKKPQKTKKTHRAGFFFKKPGFFPTLKETPS